MSYPCKCTEEINKELEPEELRLSLGMWALVRIEEEGNRAFDSRYVFPTEHISGKKRKRSVYGIQMGYCPFCGVKAKVPQKDSSKPDLQKQSAFSLVELLCVVAIVAILAALLIPAVSRAVRHARATVNNAVQFHNDRLGYAWDGDTTNQIFSVTSYNEMTNTTEMP